MLWNYGSSNNDAMCGRGRYSRNGPLPCGSKEGHASVTAAAATAALIPYPPLSPPSVLSLSLFSINSFRNWASSPIYPSIPLLIVLARSGQAQTPGRGQARHRISYRPAAAPSLALASYRMDSDAVSDVESTARLRVDVLQSCVEAKTLQPCI